MTANIKKEQTYIVSQSNRLLEADYSKSNLPARSLKVGRLIVSKVNPTDGNFRLITIKNTAIRQYLGYKTNVPYNRFNSDLENICKQLNEEPVKIQTKKNTILNAFLISSWEINPQEDETVFEISGRLREYLLDIKQNYTTYQLENIPKLNSSYSIRVYELLCQYRKIGKRKFEVEDLKRKIGCDYKLYGHLKNKAILRAQKDLAKFTDIKFDFEEIKQGKKVSALIFYIYPNHPNTESNQGVLAFLDDAIDMEDKPKLSSHITAQLIKFGISSDNVKKIIGKGFKIIEDKQARGDAIQRCKSIEMYFIEKITLLEQSKTQNNNAPGFLIKALKEDWKSPSIFQKQKNQQLSKQKKKVDQSVSILENEKKKLTKEYDYQFKIVVSDLLKNNLELQEIFNIVSKSEGNFYKNFINPNLSLLENYHQSPFLKAYVDAEFEKKHKSLFTKANEILGDIEKVEKRIKNILSSK